MSESITSRPFHPAAACERCVFGRGEHMWRCPAWMDQIQQSTVVSITPREPEEDSGAVKQ